MIENINLDGANVSAELHGYMYDAVYGYNGVFNYGGKLSYEIVSNNEIKLLDGLLINQGRFMRIVGSESIAIENGVSGVNRTDLIVAHFETDGINETHDIRVIKGDNTGAAPSIQTSNTLNGGTANDLLLYTVALNGLNIMSVTPNFDLLPSVSKAGGNTVNKVVRGDVTTVDYIKFAEIEIKSMYINIPFQIEVSQRGHFGGKVTIGFKSGETYDPALEVFAVDNWAGCGTPLVYISKVDAGLWALYIKKPYNYNYVTIHELIKSVHVDGSVNVTWCDEEVTTLPSGYITAEKYSNAKYTLSGTTLTITTK